ncbi:SDR family NAD(P)-dependent oxidoreductase [Paracoccus laeviglucosivorans]|uniref:NAD(P)-dependent dehydrogenase, short-chain alcohol dehydrogenase family n=1 Tax=Paracoccus laeviglucosivorans TaxID=1197861 RepID=A0A521AIP1_9RHOB|nr:SDR family NAD(P)-dependent oxidoreductase [Paracoccus laeviglucosivorans]SMO34621.1 NAD(P)-dependent dehydrogenase, short-chain alcohol dehydrogenase family [Paracoccus laeviglucosivorans]
MQAVVTGANRGIGAGLLARMQGRGDQVIGTSRKPSAGLVECDVARPDGFGALVGALDARPLDLLVCNAGVYLDSGQTLANGYSPQDWADTFAVNVTGVFLTVQALLPALQMGRGKIAIISSLMGSDQRAPGGSYIYRASKAAALNLGRNLATDLRKDGIAVGVYHPGWVRTEMGGSGADISLEQSVGGLIERFDALDMTHSGCFEAWNGDALPF